MSAGSELSRLLVVEPLADGGLDFDLTATPAECSALARRFDLVALDGLAARGSVEPGALPRSIVVAGRLVAEVAQTCVATLEPVPEHIDAEFRRVFTLDGEDAGDEIEIDPLDDPPEPLAGPALDIGEIVAEELSLSLDPYPRAPGAEGLPPAGAGQGGEHPFAALARRRGH